VREVIKRKFFPEQALIYALINSNNFSEAGWLQANYTEFIL